MTLTANPSGEITGKFTIPANVPAGAARVTFGGSSGSGAEAIYTGVGTITDEVRQRVTTISQVWFMGGFDPLAQTFSVPQATPIAAVDLFFSAVGAGDKIVQIRETQVGFPTQNVLGYARVPSGSINTTTHTRINFEAPVNLQANTEYALVVMCDDDVTALRVAELGKFDSNSNQWVTSQPYQIGVLLSSANASTWTAHQDRDLCFRLHRAVFTETNKSINLGTVAVTAATDLMLMAFEDRPSAQTNVSYTLGLPGGKTVDVSNGQPVRLEAPITGNVSITAKLTGNSGTSPVLLPGTQLVVGKVATTGDYVSRAIKGGAGIRVKVVFDAIIPAGSSVAVKYKGADIGDTWTTVPYVGSTAIDEGFLEVTHEITPVTEAMVQIKLELTGNTASRPRVRNLRFLTI